MRVCIIARKVENEKKIDGVCHATRNCECQNSLEGIENLEDRLSTKRFFQLPMAHRSDRAF